MGRKIDYIEMAATEYWQETGKSELDSLWIAEFFQDYGELNDFPRHNLVDFYSLVQKALTINIEKAEKLVRLQRDISSRAAKSQRKP
ncbi:hypothetical protein GALL_156810 [mine drainage metagenome]|uniref:Uncharacterized protein n=1 Tax=mine drainage metagenome TaxID=410659 RepID=A0A1J5SDN5_9ZZZZ